MSQALLVAMLFVLALGWAVVRGVVTSLLTGEIKNALAAYLEGRVRKAAARLGPDQAPDYEDEWLQELKAYGDRPFKALTFTLGLPRAASSIAADSHQRKPARADAEDEAQPAESPAGTAAAEPVPVPTQAAVLAADGVATVLRSRGPSIGNGRVGEEQGPPVRSRETGVTFTGLPDHVRRQLDRELARPTPADDGVQPRG